MSVRDAGEKVRLYAALESCESAGLDLPGIATTEARASFVNQLIDSEHRTWFIQELLLHRIGPARADPTSTRFDPLRASILSARSGDFDEACWLVFLYVHFGRHRRAGYRYARDVYGRLGAGRWDWPSVSADPGGFRSWLAANERNLQYPGPHGFGNHRKYESLSATSARGTGAAVSSYVGWVAAAGSHGALFDEALLQTGQDPVAAFDVLYLSMTRSVVTFGRIGAFDYLSTIGKLEFAPIAPGQAKLANSTGPIKGARLLFGVGTAKELEQKVAAMNAHLQVGFDSIEDAICNWQKSPDEFISFRG